MNVPCDHQLFMLTAAGNGHVQVLQWLVENGTNCKCTNLDFAKTFVHKHFFPQPSSLCPNLQISGKKLLKYSNQSNPWNYVDM